MAVKNLLDDFNNALSIARAGIKGTLKSLKKTQSKAKKLTAKKRNPRKKVNAVGTAKQKDKPQQKLSGRNPTKLVIRSRAVVPRKPIKQKPAKKSMQIDRP